VATGENVTESLVSEGLVSVRHEGVRQGSEKQHLVELEETAKAAGKGKWADQGSQVITPIVTDSIL
jgi:staphylococcal nuclease domain-containing protein 1